MESRVEKYISFEDFKNKYPSISEKAIKKNITKIPGADVTDKGVRFLIGSRYPYNVGNTRLCDSAKRRYVLLKAISQYRYVDHRILKSEFEDFKCLLKQMLCEGWIEENEGLNLYGANKYNITVDGEKALAEASKKRLLKISEIAGTFTGAVLSQVFNVN